MHKNTVVFQIVNINVKFSEVPALSMVEIYCVTSS